MATTDPIRDKKQIKAILNYFLERNQTRNYLLVVLGVHTALRISDLLRLTWSDVYDFDNNQYRLHVRVVEKKTQKHKTFALNKEAVKALKLHASATLSRETNAFLFRSNRKNRAAISRIQAYRVIRAAAKASEAKGRISCHSLRKTFGYHAWKTGVPITVIMDIYNHSSFDITRRYLGVCQDDRDNVYLNLSFA